MLRSDNYNVAMAQSLTSRKHPTDCRIVHCYIQVMIQLHMDPNLSKEHSIGQLVELLLIVYTKRSHCVKHFVVIAILAAPVEYQTPINEKQFGHLVIISKSQGYRNSTTSASFTKQTILLVRRKIL